MRTFLLVLVTCTFLPGNAQAVVRYWHLGAQTGTDTTDWNDPDNWGEMGSSQPGVPGAGDHVILNNFPPLTDPVIQGATAPTVSILTPSWHDGVTSTLNIGMGGSINTSGFARLSAGDNAVSTVNFLPGAGVSVWPILQMSFNNSVQGVPVAGTEGDSFINLDGGILHLGSLSFSNNGLNTTNIDLGTDGQLLVNGNLTDAGNGNASAWIDQGYITALDGTGPVSAWYDADNGRTVLTVQKALAGTTPARAELLNFVWRLRPSASDWMASSLPSEFNTYSGDGQMYYAPRNDGDGYLSLYRNLNPAVPDHMPSNSLTEGNADGYSAEGRLAYLYPDGSHAGTRRIGRGFDPGTGDHAIVRPEETLAGYTPQPLSGYAYPRYGNQNESLLELSGGGVTIGSNRVAGGALWEWTHHGTQFINSRDYGRQIQSAYFDPTYADSAGFFGLINPTEAGSRYTDVSTDAGRRQGSPLVDGHNTGLTQVTRTVPLEWSPQNFGGGPDNPVAWSNMILGKNITLDYAGMGPVARYETILVPPSDSANSQFEIPTGYLRAEFDRFWTYDAGLEELIEVSPAPMSNTAVSFSPESGFGGVVIADSSLTHAMGVYGVLRDAGGSVDYFTLWNFINGFPNTGAGDSDTAKFSAVYGPGSVVGGQEYHFTTWIMSGTLAEVTGYMDVLKESGELGAILVQSPGLNADFDSDKDVDGSDFLIWQRGFGILSGAARNDGDANGDGLVNEADLDLWRNQFSTSASQSATTTVPEPPTLLLLLVGTTRFPGSFRRRRRRGRIAAAEAP